MKKEKMVIVSAIDGYIELSWGSYFGEEEHNFTSDDVNALEIKLETLFR